MHFNEAVSAVRTMARNGVCRVEMQEKLQAGSSSHDIYNVAGLHIKLGRPSCKMYFKIRKYFVDQGFDVTNALGLLFCMLVYANNIMLMQMYAAYRSGILCQCTIVTH